MRIVAMEPVVVGAGMRNWVFVKLVTDEGLVGWGEATTEWRTRAVVGSVADLEPLVVGADPMRVEDLWQSMHRGQFWSGGLVSMSALSGVDQAVHDLRAQALGVPLVDLYGGRVRDRLRLYDHLGGGDPAAVYGTVPPARTAELAAASVAAGFTAVKLLPVPLTQPLPSAAALHATAATMDAVRTAVGDGVDVMVDLHGRCSPAAAIAFGRVLAEHRPWFVEEPVAPRLASALPRIAAATGLPLATGERLAGRAEFLPLLQAGGVDVVQPDVCHCGGPSELLRIASLADAFGVAVAPHNPLGPIATAHSLHLAAAIPNWLVQEQMRGAVPWFDDVLTRPLEIADGHALLPPGPGLGVAVDEAEAARHPFEPEDQIRARHADGSVADW